MNLSKPPPTHPALNLKRTIDHVNDWPDTSSVIGGVHAATALRLLYHQYTLVPTP